MILSREDICWVVHIDGTRVPFDGGLLSRSIYAATGRSGEEYTFLAESIAVAIEQYAREHQPERAVTTVEIAEMVEALLAMLGMDDLAEAYADRGQPAEIALDEMARVPGTGFELAFYRQLDAALAVRRRGVLRLRGLRDCVLRLRGTRRWSAGCRRLAEEIVQYVYARAARMPGATSVSVME